MWIEINLSAQMIEKSTPHSFVIAFLLVSLENALSVQSIEKSSVDVYYYLFQPDSFVLNIRR